MKVHFSKLVRTSSAYRELSRANKMISFFQKVIEAHVLAMTGA